jgi:hypothetical protein
LLVDEMKTPSVRRGFFILMAQFESPESRFLERDLIITNHCDNKFAWDTALALGDCAFVELSLGVRLNPAETP